MRLVGRWGFPILSVIFCSGLIFQSAGQKALQLSFVTPCVLGLLLLLLGSHMFDCSMDSKLALRFSGLESNPPLWKAVHRFAGWTWMLAGLAVIACAMTTDSLTPADAGAGAGGLCGALGLCPQPRPAAGLMRNMRKRGSKSYGIYTGRPV